MQDGVDHINIYSKGETKLGKYLSNFTYTPFIHTYDGEFKSIEGYWYWNLTGDIEQHELYGYEAKQKGRESLKARVEAGFDEWDIDKLGVKTAILCKLTQGDADLYHQFVESTLPFRHYYKYGDKIVEPKEGKWLIEFFEDLRKLLNER